MPNLVILPPAESIVDALHRVDAFWTMAEVPGMAVSEGILDLPISGGSIELRKGKKDSGVTEMTAVTFRRFPQDDVVITRAPDADEWTIEGTPSASAIHSASRMASLITMDDLATMEYLNGRMVRSGIVPSFKFTDILLRKKFRHS